MEMVGNYQRASADLNQTMTNLYIAICCGCMDGIVSLSGGRITKLQAFFILLFIFCFLVGSIFGIVVLVFTIKNLFSPNNSNKF
jgi:hypothetical protein